MGRLSGRLAWWSRWEREQRGLTQQEIAAASGVSVRRVRAIEAGRSNATLDTVEAIADAMGVDPLELLKAR